MSIKEAEPLPTVDPPTEGQLRIDQVLEQIVLDLGWVPVAFDKYGSTLYERASITGGKP
jgi:hypothetical protein